MPWPCTKTDNAPWNVVRCHHHTHAPYKRTLHHTLIIILVCVRVLALRVGSIWFQTNSMKCVGGDAQRRHEYGAFATYWRSGTVCHLKKTRIFELRILKETTHLKTEKNTIPRHRIKKTKISLIFFKHRQKRPGTSFSSTASRRSARSLSQTEEHLVQKLV